MAAVPRTRRGRQGGSDGTAMGRAVFSQKLFHERPDVLRETGAARLAARAPCALWLMPMTRQSLSSKTIRRS